MNRLAVWSLVMFGVGPSTPARSEDLGLPGLERLTREMNKLVQQHYPKATATLNDGAISFSFNTRKFMIHEPLLTGEWQDAFEEIGPQRGGIMGSLVLQPGKYGGQAAVPQAFDKRYFTTLVLAPYSKKHDCHLYVHLKYPANAPKAFVTDFTNLVNSFEKHLAGR